MKQARGQATSEKGQVNGRRRDHCIGWASGLLMVLVWCAPAAPCLAQQGSGGSEQESGPQLQEIVVTAEKRESTVLKTPISLTAVSGADLVNHGVESFAELAQDTPGVSLRTSGPGMTEIEMRGLSSSGGDAPTVGFYLDEMPLVPSAGATNGKMIVDPNLYDLERVEILRGPQGTLYGAGSMGGTVKVITAPPNLKDLATSGQLIGSSTNGGGFNHGEKGMLNLPLYHDVLALRVVVTDEHRSGWIDRIVLTNFPLEPNFSPLGSTVPGVGTIRGNVLAAPVAAKFSNVNDAEIQTLRGALLFRPVDNLSVTASTFYEHTSQGGLDAYDSPPGDNPPGELAHYQPFNVPEPYTDNFTSEALVIKYDVPSWLQLTSATSYLNRYQRQVEDGSENWQDAFGEPVFTPGAAYVEIDTTRQFAQEVRLTSASPTALQWLIGGFYQKYHSLYVSSGVDQGFVTLYGFPTPDVYTANEPFDITQRAEFGQLSYQWDDGWKLAAGLRHYAFDTKVSVVATGILGTPPGNASASASGINPSFTLSYSPNSDLMLYSTAAKGFRPGGANVPVPLNLCAPSLEALGRTSQPLSYNPDSLWSYEVGEKAQLDDARVGVNSAVYYEKWTGVQQVINLTCGFLYTDNAASARVYGAEFELKARLTSEWTASTSIGYTNGVLTATAPGTTFVKGDRLQNVPDATASAALEYSRPLSGQYNLVARASADYVGTRVDLTYGINQVPGYIFGNARLGITADKWSWYLFVDNVTNKIAELGNNSNLDVNIPSYNRVATNQPRTVGLELSGRF